MTKQTKKPDTEPIIDNGIAVDTSDIDNDLTERAKRYVFWFSYPGTDCYQNKTRAAIRAGYAKKNAVTTGYKLSKNPIIKKETERLLKEHIADDVDSMYRRYINTLETRAFFDPADFITGKTFKPIEEIAPEKHVAIEQAITNKEGNIVSYNFGSRRAAMAEIKDLHTKQYPSGDSNEYDVEETIRIMNRVAETKVSIERRRRSAEAEPDIVERPLDDIDEEL
ncbi:hypothetical protein AGMMS50255_6840 [Spirochaetia bacterium]|nr:hypothetical protein AGMMS50255_6840 [Spirochaetia bacterium]